MTAKEYLQQYRVCCRKYQGILESIEQLRAIAEKTTHALGGDIVQSSTSDRTGKTCAALADAQTEARAELISLVVIKREIIKAIEDKTCSCQHKCNCADQKAVLYHRYILQKKWELIAVDLIFDYSWVLRLHGEALQGIKSSD